MPVIMWNHTGGVLSSSVETTRHDSFGGEAYRAEAEALDRHIDRMLDMAVAVPVQETVPRSSRFLAYRWALGCAIKESALLDSPNLDANEHDHLWEAIERKCRLGIRADGSAEETWKALIPARTTGPKRPGRDVMAVSLWLQEQDLEGTIAAFGGRYGNGQKLYMRPALRALKLRQSLAKWMLQLSPEARQRMADNKRFWSVIRALAARFPSRGLGSAKRPVHFEEEQLFGEVSKVLDPLVALTT